MTLSPRILKDIVAIEREYGEQIQGLIDQKREAIAKALGAEAARSTGGQLGPGTPPDTSWNKRASPPGGEWQGIDTAPRDGSEFEIAHVTRVRWIKHPPGYPDLGAMWSSDEENLDYGVADADFTHWRPAPPREAVGVGIEGSSRTDSTDARCDATAEDAHNHSGKED